MRDIARIASAGLVSTLLVAPAFAQDSVSLPGCLPGDAVDPYADAADPDGSEQSNRYVLDLVAITSSWGNSFNFGPLSKSSKTSAGFFNSIIDGNSISRRQILDSQPGGTYGLWENQGEGINNKSSLNDPPSSDEPAPGCANQFSTLMAEFGNTDVLFGASGGQVAYSGVVTQIVNYDPQNSSRLYVDRIYAAGSGCAPDSELATQGAGAVLADGTTVFRADSFGTEGDLSCGALPLSGNNGYIINAAARDTTILNVTDDAGLLLDAGATNWVLVNDAGVRACPNVADILGTPFYLTADAFAFPPASFLSGATAPLTASAGHLASPTEDHRGLISHMAQGHPAFPGSTSGLAAMLQLDPTGDATRMNVWGLDGAAGPVSPMMLALPATVTDGCTGAVSVPGPGPSGADLVNELSAYESQVLFQGTNGQVAMNVDKSGNLLVAALVDQPNNTGARDWGFHYIAVAKIAPSGATTWHMAAYNLSQTSGPKPILDGPSTGAPTTVGFLTDTSIVTGGANLGPSMSAPMIDSAGNIWFLSAIDTTVSGGGLSFGLIRGVYDESRTCWDLELIVQQGDQIAGANSATNYEIDFLDLFDSNSVDSAAPFANSIQETGFAGANYPSIPNADPIHLGGLVLSGTITYDVDDNGVFDFDCVTNASPDEQYIAQFYLQPDVDCQFNTDRGSNQSFFSTSMCGTGLAPGDSSTWRIAGCEPGATCALFLNIAGTGDVTLFPNAAAPVTLCDIGGFLLSVPIGIDGQGNGSLTFPGSGPIGVDLTFQAVAFDSRVPPQGAVGIGASNCLKVRFGL